MQVLHGRYLSILRHTIVLAGIAGTIALPLVHLNLPISTDLSPGALRLILVWTWTAVIALIVFGIQRRSPKFIGLRGFRAYDAVELLAALIVALVLIGLIGRFITRTPPEALDDEVEVALWIRLAIAVTAGITEEFLYRGFLIEEGGQLIGSRPVAGVVQAVAFAAGHWDQGWAWAFLSPGLFGTVLTLWYFRRRSLPLCMLLHAFFDVCYVLVQ
jgi:membrane protease YdiL (CAAX protease family)